MRMPFPSLQDTSHLFDVIIIDLPDPNSVELARLYSLNFYRLCKKHLKRGGTLVTQATSPFFSRQAFCVHSENDGGSRFQRFAPTTTMSRRWASGALCWGWMLVSLMPRP